jgi:hypothetical protein
MKHGLAHHTKSTEHIDDTASLGLKEGDLQVRARLLLVEIVTGEQVVATTCSPVIFKSGPRLWYKLSSIA